MPMKSSRKGMSKKLGSVHCGNTEIGGNRGRICSVFPKGKDAPNGVDGCMTMGGTISGDDPPNSVGEPNGVAGMSTGGKMNGAVGMSGELNAGVPKKLLLIESPGLAGASPG